jgi:hypothetical protein
VRTLGLSEIGGCALASRDSRLAWLQPISSSFSDCFQLILPDSEVLDLFSNPSFVVDT